VWLVAPADMPNLQPRAIDALLEAYSASLGKSHEPARIFSASHDGRRGHPVLFPWILARDVHALADDEGLNVLTRRYPVVEVEVGDPAMFDDIDTPADYAKRRPRP
jgi:CTP:molybdopterin cytidylyltransferase MocA